MSDTPETDATAEKNIYGVACQVDVDFARKLERERDNLRQWKESMQRVEQEWDIQAIGKLLGIRLGESIRASAESAILALVAERDEARDMLEKKHGEICEIKRQRNNLQDQRDFCMGEIERLKKEAAQKDKLLAEMRVAIRWVADDSCKG